MDVNQEVLDHVFLPFFESAEQGKIVTLVEMNWQYDYRQRVGALTKEELEYVINKQLQAGNLMVKPATEYEVRSGSMAKANFSISESEVERAAKQYSKEFWEIANRTKST